MDIEEYLENMRRNSIRLHIDKKEEYICGGTRFGGMPDVPADFVWPTFETNSYNDDEVKPRPLSFIAQFNCGDISAFDTEGLLPDKGVLSFFYEMDSQLWGFDPKDKGCARVYWFEDVSLLSSASFPSDLDEYYRFPMLQIRTSEEKSVPSFADFYLDKNRVSDNYDDYDLYENVCKDCGYAIPENSSKLLGWPDIIQNNMTQECELVCKGYYLGNGWEDIPKEDIQAAEKTSLEEWRLLFQLDTVNHENFELMFGDCGRAYFYIRKEDLLAKKFHKIWFILQCY
ncbi:YwqG family protein [Anaerotignum sp.]|uniref:YwqG family protein n=1 Tax=Anaerotignum sp. TaxID=2039241 RepID=UPI0028AEB186|nr:YwqG family protein [Anaerotignum sp.]